jgi:hypothetical protein
VKSLKPLDKPTPRVYITPINHSTTRRGRQMKLTVNQAKLLITALHRLIQNTWDYDEASEAGQLIENIIADNPSNERELREFYLDVR